MIVDHYTTKQVVSVSGFSTRQLDYWAINKILVPSVSQSSGPGTRKLYSFDDLVKISFIRHLRQAGWSTQKIRKSIEHLDEFTAEKPEYRNKVLINNKKTILALCETKAGQQILLDVLNPGGQQVMWIVLEDLRAETRKNVDKLIRLADITSQKTDKAIKNA